MKEVALEGGFSIDIDTTEKQIRVIMENRIPKYGAEALYERAKQLVNDAINVEPKLPVGHYRAKEGKRGGVGGTLKNSWDIVKKDDGSIEVAFNTPYATYQHEGKRKDGTHVVENYSEAGAGKHFISKKLKMFGQAYLKAMADYIASKGDT